MIEWWIGIARQHAELFFWLTVLSVATVVAFVTIGPRLLARLPEDYFVNPDHRRKHDSLRHLNPALRALIPMLKNLVGLIFLVVGFILLFVPGQGLLTMLAGVVLMNFPGKYAMERWLVQRPQVHRSINWVRRRAGAPPLVIHHSQSQA